jgi:hypothetical protein
MVAAVLERFERLSGANYPGLTIEWEQSLRNGTLLGTAILATGRIQPFTLLLKSDGEGLVVRCVSPVGRVEPESTMAAVEESVRRRRVRIGVILGREEALYDLTVEDDVLLGDPSHDVPRVAALLSRVVDQSDILEQIHLPLVDQPMAAFESDLKRERGPAVLDWKQWCHGLDRISVDRDGLEMVATNERRQRIAIRETADTFELTGVVARPAAIDAVPDVPLRTWRRNRATQLVGFRLDQKSRVVGEAWVPKVGLNRDEFMLYVKRVAAECDLFEYHLTGKVRE